MGKRPKQRATLEDILASTSDALFPAELGQARVTIHSTDSDGDTPLHVMAWRNDRFAVQSLIDGGANVNAIGDMKETPLHIAIRHGNAAIVEALLKAGARTDIRSEFNETATEAAIAMGGEIGKMLISAR